ncbi:MAG: hypothetical protein R3D83_10230 [Caenibius sp.]
MKTIIRRICDPVLAAFATAWPDAHVDQPTVAVLAFMLPDVAVPGRSRDKRPVFTKPVSRSQFAAA